MATIVVSATGASGNFYPFFLIAQQLKERGHYVKFATGSDYYRDRIEAKGIQYCHVTECELRPEVLKDSVLTRKVLSPTKSLKMLFTEMIFPSLKQGYEDLNLVCQGADLLVSGVLPFAASLVHEKEGIPWISVGLQTGIFMSDSQFVLPYVPWVGFIPYLSPFIGRILKSFLRISIDSWSEEWFQIRSDLQLLGKPNIFLDCCHSPILQLAAFSPLFFDRLPDWPQHRYHTGFILPKVCADKLSPGLVEFLSDGEPPLVFTRGGSSGHGGEKFFNICIETMKSLKSRAVISYGELPDTIADSIIRKAHNMPHVYVTGVEPYSALFQKAKVIVHHGGMGTTGEALRAGVPMVIVSVGADHPSNAYLIERMGCGVRTREKILNAKSLSKLIAKVSHKKFDKSAKAIAKKMENEDGLSQAISHIEELLK